MAGEAAARVQPRDAMAVTRTKQWAGREEELLRRRTEGDSEGKRPVEVLIGRGTRVPGEGAGVRAVDVMAGARGVHPWRGQVSGLGNFEKGASGLRAVTVSGASANCGAGRGSGGVCSVRRGCPGIATENGEGRGTEEGDDGAGSCEATEKKMASSALPSPAANLWGLALRWLPASGRAGQGSGFLVQRT